MKSYFNDEFVNDIIKAIDLAKNIVIITHSNPDGDAVGSVTAFEGYLSSKSKDSIIIVPNQYPDYLSFLDKGKKIHIDEVDPVKTKFYMDGADLIVALDFNQLKRVDGLELHVRASKAVKILIDHHPGPESDAFSYIVSTTEISSTCELLYWLIKKMEHGSKSKMPYVVAKSLYVGMMTDTNNFSNSVSSSTFRMAYDLLEAGVDKETLQLKVFGGFSEDRMRLMGHALLNKMKIIKEYGAGFIILTKHEFDQFGYSEGDTEGFVNMPLNIKGVTISALFSEKEDHIRVSLRSSDDFSVNKFSKKYFNGAGHERAAGGKLYMSVEDVPEYFEKSLRAMLDKQKRAQDL
jgi:phosphoesterase RecJ-like protein